MKLRRIELQGFKSFADRVIIEIRDGITAIVGPNGSGKSNILDAIRWCLGEQSYRTLRADSVEDVLFSGTDNGRKPAGVAEVTLFFELLNPSLIEKNGGNSELSISRISYRSGETEYLMNGRRCRLKDILDFLMEMGITSKSFSIIAQGEISEVATAKPETLRFYLDEAAGISKYRKRREETLRRMEKTSENLERIKDLVSELSRQKNSLWRQAKKAERYRALVLEEKALKYLCFQEKLKKIKEELSRHSSFLSSIEAEIRKLREEENLIEAEENILRNELTLLSSQFDEFNRDAGLKREEVKKLNEEIAIFEKEKRENILKKASLEERAEGLKNQRNYLQSLIEEKKDLLIKEKEVLEESEKNYLSSEKQLLHLESSLKEVEEKREEERKKLFSVTASIAKLTSSIESLREELRKVEFNEKEMIEHLEKVERDVQPLKENLERERRVLEELKTELTNVREKIREVISHEERERENLNALSLKVMEMEKNCAELKVKIDMARDYELSFMERNEGDNFPKLGELISPHEGWERAIGVALGDAAKYSLVERVEDLDEILNNLDRKNISKTGFIVLEKIKEAEGVKSNSPETLSERIEFKREDLRGVFKRIFLSENLKEGFNLFQKFSPDENFEVVTKEGERIYNKFFVEVIGDQNPSSKYFTMRERRITMEEEFERNQRELREMKEQKLQLEDKLNGFTRTKSQLQEKEREILKSIEEGEDKLNRFREEINEAQRVLAIFNERLKSYRNRKDQILREISALEGELNSLIEEEKNLKEKLKIFEEERLDLLAKVENLRREITSTRAEYEKAHERWKLTSKELEHQKTLHEGCIKNLNDTLKMIQELEEKNNELEGRLNAADSLRKKIEDEYSRIQDKLSSINLRQKEINSGLESLRRKRSELRNLLEGRMEERNELKVKMASREEEAKHIEEEIKNLTDSELLAKVEEILKSGNYVDKNLEVRLQEIEESKLKMGNINFAALEEFEEVKARFEFAESQKKDLEESMEDLKVALQSIDEECKKKIEETLQRVNDDFSRIVFSLFDGGTGRVVLQDPHSPLYSGVEVNVSIPPSRVKNLNLLSGGQRSAISFAFLFALSKARNSPVFIFDEVDAALDDENIEKFLNVLKEIKNNSQVIIITHNKKTIRSADYIYGVTMEEEGVSKVLSLKLVK